MSDIRARHLALATMLLSGRTAGCRFGAGTIEQPGQYGLWSNGGRVPPLRRLGARHRVGWRIFGDQRRRQRALLQRRRVSH